MAAELLSVDLIMWSFPVALTLRALVVMALTLKGRR